MSFLQTLKDTLQSKIGQAVIAEVPDVIHAGAEIAANPNQAIHVLAELIGQSIADIHERLSAVESTPAIDPASVPVQSVIATGADIAAIVEKVLEAINPQLAQYAPIVELVAQHFPHLQPAS
jgi:thiamine monophosphate synthase